MRSGRRGWQPSPATALVLTIAVALVGNLATSTVQAPGRWWAPTVWATTAVLVVVAVLVERAKYRTATTTADALTRLAAAVTRQWTNEIAGRGVWQPVPLRVRWSSTGRPVAAERDVVLDEGATEWREVPLEGHLGEIVTTFTGLPHRQMVVLGGPGAGKSVLAALLTLDLVEGRRQADEPVAVLLALASWDPASENVETFLTRRLTEEYGFLADPAPGGTTVAEHLLAHRQLVAVVDGLDELPAERHGPAIEALDRFAAAGHPLVLTCRAEEYEQAVTITGAVLSRAAVVELRPLDVADVIAFLRHPAPARPRWEPVLSHLREHPDGQLATVLSTPLMVSLARARYLPPATDPTELLNSHSPQELREVLIDGFVPALYGDSRDYPPGMALRWLSYLAYQLDGAGTRELWWWTLRPNLFSTREPGRGWTTKFLYWINDRRVSRNHRDLAILRVVRRLLHARERRGQVSAVMTIGAAVAASLVALVFVGPGGAVRHALVAAVLVGVNAAGAFRAMWPASLPAPAAPRHHIRVRLAFGVLFGLLCGILTGDLLTCCLAGLLVGCAAAVLPSWTWPVRGAEATPRLTLRANRRAFGAAAVQYGLVGGLVTGVVGSLLPGVADPSGTALTAAGVFAVAAALGAGLWTWARYRVIHLLTAFQGRLPWRLWRFLADAHQRGALRQAGTAWQFRHGLVQEYLADCARAWHSLYLTAAKTRDSTGVGAFFRSLANRRRAAKLRARAAKLREWSDRWAAEVYPNLSGDRDPIDQLRTMAEAGSFDAASRLAHLLAEQDRVDEAIAFLRTHPDALWLQHEIANLLAINGRTDELRELAASDRYAARRLADLLTEQGRLDEAEVVLCRLADTGAYRAAFDVAQLLAARGRFDDAVRYLSTRRVDRYSRALDLTQFYQANDRLDEAIATIRSAADRDPTYTRYLVDLLAEKGDRDELRARSDARDHDAGRALARLLTEEGDVDEALAVLRTHAGEDAETAVILAKELARQGRMEEALPLLRAHFAAGRTWVAVPLAELLIGSGRVDDAQLILRSRVDTGDAQAQALLESLRRWE